MPAWWSLRRSVCGSRRCPPQKLLEPPGRDEQLVAGSPRADAQLVRLGVILELDVRWQSALVDDLAAEPLVEEAFDRPLLVLVLDGEPDSKPRLDETAEGFASGTGSGKSRRERATTATIAIRKAPSRWPSRQSKRASSTRS